MRFLTELIFFTFFFLIAKVNAQLTPFEKSGNKETASFEEIVSWYQQLDSVSNKLLVKEMGNTDAGLPLQIVLISADGKFDPAEWHLNKDLVILINNGIHPGEPDGIDASMMLARDYCNGKIKLPSNVKLCIIPVYNIGGCLNRNAYTRANQNGPLEYGFRGNSQNLDLNRDFTKCDSREARSFTEIFHYLQPELLVDTHVSDGADFQYTMTLISTQYDKMNGPAGNYLKSGLEPLLYKEMAAANTVMTPYVNFETTDLSKGMAMFYDPPRYSSGYASLFGTIGFITETHMLKPFKERVNATYTFLKTLTEIGSGEADRIIRNRQLQLKSFAAADSMPLKWVADTSEYSLLFFKGYEQAYKKSAATGLDQMYYDHDKPFQKPVKYYNRYLPQNFIRVPKAYIIPQGWYAVIDLLKLNNVIMQSLEKDTIITVSAYRINEFKSYNRPYEKHHKNYGVKTSVSSQQIRFRKNDMIVWMNQPANRYMLEMLEPTGDDSFFAWNFFDAILQQKEGYSDYRWEEIAAAVLKNNPSLQQKLELKKAAEPEFARNSSAILEFIYENSPYYEDAYLRYPVFRLE